MTLRHLALLLAVSTIAADCPGDSTSPNDSASDPVVGAYTLQKLNGNNLPTSFNDGTKNVTVSSGSFTVNGNGTFAYSEVRSDGNDAVNGTWTKSGTTYTFNPTELPGEATQTDGIGTLSGTTLTLTVSEPGTASQTRTYAKSP